MDLVIFYRCEPSAQLAAWLIKQELEHICLKKQIHVEEVRIHNPKQVVIDVDKYDNALLDCQKLKVKLPSIKVVVTSFNSELEEDFKRVGVNHFILKKPIEHEMINALSPSVRKSSSPLTKREEEILNLMVLGHTNKNIAEMLKLSIKTVEMYRAKVFRKMGASNVADLTYLVVRSNMVDV